MRRRHAQNFLERLQERFGRISDLVEPSSIGVLVSRTLTSEHLFNLIHHQAAAVHIKGFYPPEACEGLAAKLTQSKMSNWMVSSVRGLESSDVMSCGTPYNVAMERGEGAIKEYFDTALDQMRHLRQDRVAGEAAAPMTLSPLDKLRLELDEVWMDGATVTKNPQGQPYVAGVARVMEGPTKSIQGFIHVDELAPLSETHGLFSANIYLRMPPTGGHLSIWPVSFHSRWDFYRHAALLSHLTEDSEHGQMALHNAFPKPHVIRVEPGDLVLLCAQRPHAANGFPMGSRVSMQTFISHQQGKPLSLDS
ncbi:unnamed protein product [Chrysoparadoxa australica]